MSIIKKYYENLVSIKKLSPKSFTIISYKWRIVRLKILYLPDISLDLCKLSSIFSFNF